ncbi:MAG: hypothetical protein ACPL4C_03360 [Brevinematia bacterium]
MPNFVDITNRIEKDQSKKYSFTIAYIGKKSLFAFRNRLEDLVSFFGNISNIEVIYLDCSNIEITEAGDLLDKSRIIVPDRDISIVSAVNAAINFASSNNVLVMFVNYRLSLLSLKNIKDLFNLEPTLICITPYVSYQGKKSADIVKVGITNDLLDWVVVENSKNPSTLTPNNFLGFYNKSLFVSIGGFNEELDTPISLIEFGIRAWSSQCMIISSKHFLVDKIADFEVETSVGNLDKLSTKYKYFLSRNPKKLLFKDIISMLFLILKLDFKGVYSIIKEIRTYSKYKNRISIFSPEVEKIFSVINYYDENFGLEK